MLQDIIQALILVTALSADSFISSFAYGAKKISIPFPSVIVINVICSIFLGLSLFAGELLRPLLQPETAKVLCFVILFILGGIKLLDNVIKAVIRKYTHLKKQIKFKLLSLNFILNIYANPEDADEDKSKVLSPGEAASLAVALSLDGLGAGLGAALGGVNKMLIITLSLAVGILAVTLGSFIGNKASGKRGDSLSWLGGAGLIALAVLKLV